MKTALRGLYVITDNRLTPHDQLQESVEQALRGGARIVQYRDKQSTEAQRLEAANALNRLCREYDALFIINDDVQLAKHCAAHGVHLGKDDEVLASARDFLGANFLIGASCYNRIELAEEAVKAGADYIAFGRFFASATKPDAVQADTALLQQARALNVPVCAIGGITKANAAELIAAGADMIAVVEGVFGQPDITAAATGLASLFPTP
jgi:thiamine-phosphate pyrophosphorylase